jgi:hypothetical protein
LGGLPLALEQAAAYIQTTQGTLASYLALFRHRRSELLSRGEPTGYNKTVASTWALAFDRLEQTAPGAVGLLRLLAFCASEAIPLRLLLQPNPRAPRCRFGATEGVDGAGPGAVPRGTPPRRWGDCAAWSRRSSPKP